MLKHILKENTQLVAISLSYKNYEKYTATAHINVLFLFRIPGLYCLMSLHFLHLFHLFFYMNANVSVLLT